MACVYDIANLTVVEIGFGSLRYLGKPLKGDELVIGMDTRLWYRSLRSTVLARGSLGGRPESTGKTVAWQESADSLGLVIKSSLLLGVNRGGHPPGGTDP